jgi:hypothetical protein
VLLAQKHCTERAPDLAEILKDWLTIVPLRHDA